MIDTSPSRKWNELNRNLQKLNIEKLDLLILTHTHFDHVGNAKKIKENYKARIVVHRHEKFYIENGINKFPGGTNTLTRFLITYVGNKFSEKFNFAPCEADIIIDSIWSLHDFGFNAYVLPTPGHSNGSMSLIIDDEIALVGDAMFGVFKKSIFPPFADDPVTLIDSWGKLLDTNCELFLPAHGFANARIKVQKNFNAWKKKS